MTSHRTNNGQAIVISGPVGAGKTTIMSALTDLLHSQGVACAGIDMDSLRWFYPHPPGDRFGASIGRRHLAMLAGSYHELGIPTLILSDVVEHDDDRALLADAMPDYEIHVVRLHVAMGLIMDRLKQRESDEHLQWYLERAPELQRIMEEAGVGDIVIDVGERTPREVATDIASKLSLI